LAAAISFQGFETIAWETAQGLQMRGGFQPVEAFFCLPAETLEGRDVPALSKFARPLVSIGEYHWRAYAKRRITSSVISFGFNCLVIRPFP
jgi:hypothetical protein